VAGGSERFPGRQPPLTLIQGSEMSELTHLHVGIVPNPEGQQTGGRRRVKRRASRRARSLTARRLTRLAGLLWPGRARSRRHETTMSAAAAPTDRQLRYLRTLANRTATTFALPATRREASREIERLIALSQLQPSPLAEPVHPEALEDAYATAVRPEEVTGFGSSATWRSTPPARSPQGAGALHGSEVQLLRYRVSAGERLLVGERRGECVHVTDRPARGAGQRYAVEELDSCEGLAALRALVEDYKARAQELDQIPMATGALLRTLGGGHRNV
jgi:hypothetical protein